MGFLLTIIVYIIMMMIAIPMFNYLEYGKFWFWVNDDDRNKRKY